MPSETPLEAVKNRLPEIIISVAVIAVLSAIFGSLITVRTGFWVFVSMVLLVIAANRVGEFSLTFALSAAAVGVILLKVFLRRRASPSPRATTRTSSSR